jgi:sec-independent protein translocase protein TatC
VQVLDASPASSLTPLDHEYERTILENRLVPEKVNVEPAQIASAMRISFPGQWEGAGLSPHAFIPADFKTEAEATAFAKQLVDAEKETAGSPARRIWQELTDEQREQLKQAQAAGNVSPALLIAALNEVLAKQELHDSAEYKSLKGINTAAVAELRAGLKEEPGEEATRRLNKLLIAGEFSEHFRTPRLNLVSFYNWKPVKVRFQVLNAQESFMIYLKASLLTGVVIAAPWIFYNIWNFVATGLYPHEKSQVFIYLPISLILFFAGASLAFGFVFEPVLNFLFQFNQGLNAEFDPRIGEWLSFVLILPLGFGISFQLPLVMLFVNRLGLVTVDLYIQQWRMAILIIFVVAMVLTPADPISMLLMAIPLCGLYVLGIGMCLWMPRSRSPFDQAYEPSA